IARDYEAPGIGVPHRSEAPPVRAYVGEPLGPVTFSDRGSGKVSLVFAGSLPSGMSDLTRSDVLMGQPDAAQTVSLSVQAVNTYYGATEASVAYFQPFIVRARPAVERIGGTDRYEAAVNASKSRFPGTAATVYMVSGEKFADALSAGAVAIQAGAPLLLTNAGSLPGSVAAELKRLQPAEVVVVGGPASVSDAVMAQIAASTGRTTTVERIGGADRYEVSQNLLKTAAVFSPLYIASGRTYPDALAAAPAAATGGNVVLLVDGALNTLSDATMEFIAASRSSLILVGGPATISSGIQTQLQSTGRTVTRFGGADRYETATLVSRFVLIPSGTELSRVPSNPVPLHDRDTVYLASGENYPDALAGGVAAGLAKAPLYITPKNCVPRPVLLDIGSTGATKVVVLGGPNTLAAPVESLTVCP
ncbi:MAG: cell wall-binding repeat-containing protein, partial [Herbiconiux sp.]|nr:cell wall-binding repeat-containing protein [Herbiconiux sp.]